MPRTHTGARRSGASPPNSHGPQLIPFPIQRSYSEKPVFVFRRNWNAAVARPACEVNRPFYDPRSSKTEQFASMDANSRQLVPLAISNSPHHTTALLRLLVCQVYSLHSATVGRRRFSSFHVMETKINQLVLGSCRTGSR